MIGIAKDAFAKDILYYVLEYLYNYNTSQS